MSAIDSYRTMQGKIWWAKKWLGMIGKEYHGGGGGYGRIHSLRMSPEIYYQESDGAKNYHEADREFVDALSNEIINRFDDLSKAAIEKMEEGARVLARQAALEHARLMEDAGLPALRPQEVPK